MRVYLDTSALIKRYITEDGSQDIDKIFISAADSKDLIIISYWNIGEAATVFDKFSRKSKSQQGTKLMNIMLDEFQELARLQMINIVEVNQNYLKEAIRFVFKYHIYVSDAIQISTAKVEMADLFVSGDKILIKAASEEGMKTFLV